MTEPTFLNITDDEYFGTYAVSSSGLRCFATEGSWLYFKKYVERTVTRDYTDPLRIGHGIHQAVELGDDWTDLVYRTPQLITKGNALDQCLSEFDKIPDHFGESLPINTRSPIHRRYLELHAEDHRGDMLQLSDSEVADIETYRVAITESDECMRWLTAEGPHEMSCFREDERTGMAMKCKVDKAVVSSQRKTLIDIKSTRKCLPHQFVAHACGRNGIGGLGYHYQAEWYLRVTGFDEFKFIVVTKTPAPEAFLFTPTETILDQARDANDNLFWSIANCHLMESWHNTGHNADLPLDPFERIPT